MLSTSSDDLLVVGKVFGTEPIKYNYKLIHLGDKFGADWKNLEIIEQRGDYFNPTFGGTITFRTQAKILRQSSDHQMPTGEISLVF